MRSLRCLTLFLVASTVLPIGSPALALDPAERGDSYLAGQRALDQESWTEAVSHFAEAVELGGDDADAALYWQAYALHRSNRPARAQLALEELQERYPESSWVDDARALGVEIQGRGGEALDPEAVADEELKLIALNALVQVEWERARPLLAQFLSHASPRMRERALFVLSQSDAPEAKQMLVDVATDPSDPEMAIEAVHYLGFYGDDETRQMLRRLYAGTADVEVREQVLEAMMIAEDLQGLLPIARTESNQELRRTAVEQLGMLEATAELRQLYEDEGSPEIREQILEALMLADDHEALLALARTEPDEDLRGTAIEQLGFLEATADLRELYRGEKSAEIRGSIAEALMFADDAEFLIEIAKTDPDEEVRGQAIEGIGMIDSPEATTALSELYRSSADVETKRQIIEAFMLQDDASTLIEIARTETDPDLRRAALETLSMMDSEAATDFLLGLLEGTDPG